MGGLRTALRWLTAGSLALILGVGAAVAIGSTGPSGPNLRVSALAGIPGTVAAGSAFSVKVTVVNRGDRRGGATRTQFWLSRDARPDRTDVLLSADLAVPRLAPHRRRAGTAQVKVPADTPAGAYRLLACADGRGLLHETSETDNCRASRSRVVVTRTAGAAVPEPGAAPPAANVVITRPTTTTTTTGTTTTDPPPCGTADADADGIPDCADPCPNTPSASGYCPQTIYDIATGLTSTGAKVEVADALVTAVAPDGKTAWLAVKPTDAGWTGPQHSGLEADLSALSSVPAVSPGDRVTVRATVGAALPHVTLTSLTVTASSGETITPVDLAAATLATTAPLYAAVLVHVTGDTPYSLTAIDAGGWTMTPSGALPAFRVGGRAMGTLPAKSTGAVFTSFTGFADMSGLDPVVLPRTVADIVET